jgi:hypothetical protein
MKYSLTTTILSSAVFAATALAAREDGPTFTEKARDAAHDAGRATRIGWSKTKAFFSDEMPVYHEGAQATLAALAKKIDGMKAGAVSAPAYFRTRLLALEEQQEYLAARLALLKHVELRDRTSGPRHEFDRCLADLERAVDHAESGAGAAPRTVLK